MSPTWSSLTLLVLSTIMLVVTWMAASRRLKQTTMQSARGNGLAVVESVQDVQNVLLVRLIGVTLALSSVVLFAMVTVLTDAVSSWWCRMHGVLIYLSAVLAAVHLAALAATMWLTIVAEVPEPRIILAVRRATPIAVSVALFAAFIVSVGGSFEQQTLFCFVYHPAPLALVLYQIPLFLLCVTATFCSGHAGLTLLRAQPLSLQTLLRSGGTSSSPLSSGMFKTGPATSPSAARHAPGSEPGSALSFNNDTFSASQQEFVATSNRFEDLSTGAIALQLGDSDAIVRFSQIQAKATLAAFALAVGGTAAALNMMLQGAPEDHYYQGAQAEEGNGVVIHESQLGWAVFYLSAVGIFLFSALATDRSLWEMHEKFQRPGPVGARARGRHPVG